MFQPKFADAHNDIMRNFDPISLILLASGIIIVMAFVITLICYHYYCEAPRDFQNVVWHRRTNPHLRYIRTMDGRRQNRERHYGADRTMSIYATRTC